MSKAKHAEDSAAARTETPSTSTQIDFQGIPVVIEHPKGSVREGVDEQGQPWQREMDADYGYIPDTVGKGDREPLDVYLGEDEEASEAYIIEQLKADGSFDEFKCMLGFPSAEQALITYQAHFPKEWEYDRVADIWPVPVDRLADLVAEERDQEVEPYEQAAKAEALAPPAMTTARWVRTAAPAEKKEEETEPKKKVRDFSKKNETKEKRPPRAPSARGQFPKPPGYRKLLEQENSKTIKGEKLGFLTGVLYLAPAKEAGGRDLCPGSSEGCRHDCLYGAGMAAVFKTIKEGRIKKTRFLFDSPKEFMDSLRWDIEDLERQATYNNMTPVVRINGTSDIPKLAMQMAREYPTIHFLDYTKLAKPERRMMDNYHLTFSRSEENEHLVADALNAGVNVAVVFNVKPGADLPTEFMGHRVIDGDENDLRFLDEDKKLPERKP